MDALVQYFGPGVKEEVSCCVSMQARSIILDSEKFRFSVILDIVDADEFMKVLNGRQRRAILTCEFETAGKKYKGKRKFLRKKDSVAVSQGGVRLEFGKQVQQMLIQAAGFIQKV